MRGEDLSRVEKIIYEIRGKQVMLDFDIAELYQIETKKLKQAVRRNLERFPSDFMFELGVEEYNLLSIRLRSQNVTSKKGGVRYMPFAFTQEGVAMLSGVLRSPIAINVNINIMRSFVAIRQYFELSKNMSKEIEGIKDKVSKIESEREEILRAINDLSEDNQNEFDTIYLAMAELAAQHKAKIKEQVKERVKIGFKRDE